MSSENHGVPEDDDPFAYLYRGEGADGSAAPETAPLPGVPRTSYHQATQVGRTQYGQPQQAPQGYGQQQPQLPHQEQPTAQYSPPQQYGAPAAPYQAQQGAPKPPPPGGRAGARTAGGGGRNGRGVMIGTVAVGVAVVIGICVTLLNSGPDKSANAGSGTSTAPAAVGSAQASTSDSPSPTADPTSGTVAPVDAATLTLTGGAKTNNDHKHALSAGGTFVDGMATPGATVTWTVTAPAKGSYYLWVRYANATGKDSGASVIVNQKPAATGSIGLKDYGSNGSWDSWFSSYSGISLKKGQNTIALTCTAAAACNFNLDQLALAPPSPGSSSRPAAW